jgi:hypothetical protein
MAQEPAARVMNIALGYGTFQEDPALWLNFIRTCAIMGHELSVVSLMRLNQMEDLHGGLQHLIKTEVVSWIATGGREALPFCDSIGCKFDVWIARPPSA